MNKGRSAEERNTDGRLSVLFFVYISSVFCKPSDFPIYHFCLRIDIIRDCLPRSNFLLLSDPSYIRGSSREDSDDHGGPHRDHSVKVEVQFSKVRGKQLSLFCIHLLSSAKRFHSSVYLSCFPQSDPLVSTSALFCKAISFFYLYLFCCPRSVLILL